MADLGDLSWHRIVGAAAVLVLAVGIAVVLRLLTGRLFKRAGDTRWTWDDLAARLIKDLAVPVSVLLGLWGAARALELPGGTLAVIAKALTAAAILIVSLALARLIAGSVTSIAMVRQGVAGNVTIFANITRVLVIGVGVLVMLQSLGISISPLLGALGVGGLAVALALQDTLANLFAGVHVLASKTIEPGDYIKLSSGQEGYVVDINWRNTSIRTLSDNIEVIPNQRFSDTILTNYHRPAEDMSLLIQARVAYESDLERVENVVVEVGQEVMNEVQGGVKDSETLVRFHTFGDSSIGFTVILRTDEFGDQFRLKHEFVKRLHRRFAKEGIEMPYPRRQLILPDGEGAHGLVSG
ncbi:small-conductance mechanosensitive channel [Actinomadura coerulea]|uniref:Small-conductance mechanosensitive channel n=1 Tax=Actinomadura coerulea TaxID=46159 RepID=A0A7X0FYC3_9ACTN|nr:mechanosensitive ion channel family protein [Actinomadura coerulea]MBB6395998.1 small-conductance mechanosensitive channel [Actinomadura coerulea]GGQ30898.1 mechanosensitive ion channel protein [Actinomadura coerulea]